MKKVDYKTVIECVKDVKYILYGLKKTCLGVLNRRERDNDNETGLKERGGIEMSTTVLPLRDARSFALNTYLYCVSLNYYFFRHRFQICWRQ